MIIFMPFLMLVVLCFGLDSGPDVANAIRQLGLPNLSVLIMHGRNTTVRLYQKEVWEGTCNCFGPECVG
jgi:hypothetical protein